MKGGAVEWRGKTKQGDGRLLGHKKGEGKGLDWSGGEDGVGWRMGG